MSTLLRSARVATVTALIAAVLSIVGYQPAIGSTTFADSLAPSSHLTTSLNMFGGTTIPSAGVATQLAQSNDIIVVGAYRQLNGFGAAMLAANPDLKIFVYQNGMYSSSSGYPADWYMHDQKGNRIQSTAGKQYLMNPNSTSSVTEAGQTSAGWKARVVNGCRNALATAPGIFSGCWIDMLGTAPLTKAYNVNGAVPWNSQTGATYTTAQWIQLTGSVAAAVGQGTSLPVLGNGLSSGPVFFSGNSALLNFTNGAHAESWMRNATAPITWRPSVSQWSDNVNMLIDGAAAGKAIQATVKTWTTSTAAQRDAWRSFAYASYLIGNSGSDYFQFSSAHATLPWNDLSPIYSLQLGRPLLTGAAASDYLQGGLYQRAFQTGLVLVNPGTSAVTVPLSTTYHDAYGRSYSGSVTLAAGSGVVLSTVG
jgi:putative glycosyl hydrolase-like family 15 (GHL15) protein